MSERILPVLRRSYDYTFHGRCSAVWEIGGRMSINDSNIIELEGLPTHVGWPRKRPDHWMQSAVTDMCQKDEV